VATAAAVAANAKPAPAVGSDEISSMVANLLGGAWGGAAARSPDSRIGSAMPNIDIDINISISISISIKDQQVSMEGDNRSRPLPDGNCRQGRLDYGFWSPRRKRRRLRHL